VNAHIVLGKINIVTDIKNIVKQYTIQPVRRWPG